MIDAWKRSLETPHFQLQKRRLRTRYQTNRQKLIVQFQNLESIKSRRL